MEESSKQPLDKDKEEMVQISHDEPQNKLSLYEWSKQFYSKESLPVLLLIAIIAQFTFILLVNTSSFHNFKLPDRSIWTLLLTVYIIGVFATKQKIENSNIDRYLFISVILSVLASLYLVLFNFRIYISYYVFVFTINILLLSALVQIKHPRIRFLTAIYLFQVLQLFADILRLSSLSLYLTLSVELIIFVGILYYIYKMGISFDELFFVIIAGIFGYNLGKFIAERDVPYLIFTILFRQTLNIGAYDVTKFLSPSFFLSIHFAEVFALLMFFVMIGRSISALSIIALGIEMSYPPLLAIRAMLILYFIQVNDLKPHISSPEEIWMQKVSSQTSTT